MSAAGRGFLSVFLLPLRNQRGLRVTSSMTTSSWRRPTVGVKRACSTVCSEPLPAGGRGAGRGDGASNYAAPNTRGGRRASQIPRACAVILRMCPSGGRGASARVRAILGTSLGWTSRCLLCRRRAAGAPPARGTQHVREDPTPDRHSVEEVAGAVRELSGTPAWSSHVPPRRALESAAGTKAEIGTSRLVREFDGPSRMSGAASPSRHVLLAGLGPHVAPGHRSATASEEEEALESSFVPLAVSPRKAARYLDVGHDAIYQLLNQGRLRSVKLGRRRLIPMSELQRFLSDELG